VTHRSNALRRVRPALLAAGALVLLGGCTAAYEPVPTKTDLGAGEALSHTASLSHTLVLDGRGHLVACTQPAPDAGFSQSAENEISISLVEVGTSTTDADETAEESAEVELAGRTPAVLITRELFFRLCEFARNQKLSNTQATQLYSQTLDAVKTVWATEAGNTKVTISDTVQDTIQTTAGSQLPSFTAPPQATTPPTPPASSDQTGSGTPGASQTDSQDGSVE
jgi:hypothetical protein